MLSDLSKLGFGKTSAIVSAAMVAAIVGGAGYETWHGKQLASAWEIHSEAERQKEEAWKEVGSDLTDIVDLGATDVGEKIGTAAVSVQVNTKNAIADIKEKKYLEATQEVSEALLKTIAALKTPETDVSKKIVAVAEIGAIAASASDYSLRFGQLIADLKLAQQYTRLEGATAEVLRQALVRDQLVRLDDLLHKSDDQLQQLPPKYHIPPSSFSALTKCGPLPQSTDSLSNARWLCCSSGAQLNPDAIRPLTDPSAAWHYGFEALGEFIGKRPDIYIPLCVNRVRPSLAGQWQLLPGSYYRWWGDVPEQNPPSENRGVEPIERIGPGHFQVWAALPATVDLYGSDIRASGDKVFDNSTSPEPTHPFVSRTYGQIHVHVDARLLGDTLLLNEMQVSTGREGFPGNGPESAHWQNYKQYYSAHTIARLSN